MVCKEWPEVKLENYEGVWVAAFVDDNGEIEESSLQLIGAARTLADKLRTHVGVALIGYGVKKVAEDPIYYGADRVYLVDDERLSYYYPTVWGQVLSELASTYRPEVFLIPATLRGREVAPYVANSLRTGITADLTAMDVNEKGEVVLIRPPFGGFMLAHIVTRDRRPIMGSVRPNVFPTPVRDENRKGEIFEVSLEIPSPRGMKLLSREQITRKEEVPIEKSHFIVAGGKGIGSKEGFKLLKMLADLLGGVVAGSRKAVDAGWIKPENQVGQTGKSVKPNLYFAIAISGTAQHVFGIREAKRVVAINIDPDAPIFEHADYGIVGDYREVIPALIEALKEVRGGGEGYTQVSAGDKK